MLEIDSSVINFTFDVEAQNLHEEGFAYGYLVTIGGGILEQGKCYSIEGAQNACGWVKKNVIPKLDDLSPYLENRLDDIDAKTLPRHIVKTNRELRDRFYERYIHWKDQGAVFWADVSFPVETNFLSAMIKDGNGLRNWDGPYQLMDVACYLDVNIDRREYCGMDDETKHGPLENARASAFALLQFRALKFRELKALQSNSK